MTGDTPVNFGPSPIYTNNKFGLATLGHKIVLKGPTEIETTQTQVDETHERVHTNTKHRPRPETGWPTKG